MLQLFKDPLSDIPIKISNIYIQNKLIQLTTQVIESKISSKDTTTLEQQIDNLVYKLYELTYQEVKIIDPEFALTEQEYDAIKMEY